MKRAVFLDRDGTIIVEKNYLSDPEQVEVFPGAAKALRRLQEAGLIHGKVEESSGLRRRQVFALTRKGLAALREWLRKPVSPKEVVSDLNELFLRFAFMDQVLGKAVTVKFLKEFKRELQSYVPALRQYLQQHQAEMPTSGRLALESGIRAYEAQIKWARYALAIYASKKEGRKQ